MTATTEPNTSIDPDCVLRGTLGHTCANRDGAERMAAGLPPLRPGSTCFQGAHFQMSAEADAKAAAVGLAKKVRTLLDVLHEYGYTHGDAEMEIADATDACFVFEVTGTVAGWHK